jgi:hypothetical protein
MGVLALAFAAGGSSCATGSVMIGLGGAGTGTGADGGIGGAGGGTDGGSDAESDAPIPCLHQSDCTAVVDACNIGSCVNNLCVKKPANEGATCDDGLYCTEMDVCVKGTCKGMPKMCPGVDACNVGMCDEPTQTCKSMPGNDGAICTPTNDMCFSSGFCSAGVCLGSTPVDCTWQNDNCNLGVCDPVKGCQKMPLNGQTCNDGLFCTTGDKCTGGVCMGSPILCPPTTKTCQVNACSEAFHACQLGPAPDGTSCSTMNPCLTGEACTGGLCGGGSPTNEGMPCTSSNACMQSPKCTAGTCTGTMITACANNDGCCPPGCTAANDNDCNCSVNLALTATGSASVGGSGPGYGPVQMNNGIGKSNCNAYSWITDLTTPNGAFWELDWPAPVTIASFYIETPNADGTGQCPGPEGRNIASADVQTWNGTSWVTATSFSGKSGDIQLNIQPPVSTTKLRLFNVTYGPTCPAMCNGNSLMYEWHVFSSVNCIPPPD